MRSSLVDKQRPPQSQSMHRLDHNGHAAAQPPTPMEQSVNNATATASTGPVSFWSRLVPREGWAAFFLLAIALYCIVTAIGAANWVTDGHTLYYGPVLGLLLGLAVAKAPRLPQVLLHIVACLVGILFSAWIVCAFVYHISLRLLFFYLISAFSGQSSVQSVGVGQMIFFFYLFFLCFFLGYFGSWLVYRALLPWLVAIVYSAMMLVDLNYVSVSKSYLNYYVAIMLGALLLLIARVHLASQVTRWVENGLYIDRNWSRKIKKRCMQGACLIMLFSLPFSLYFPVLGQPDSGKVFWSHLDQTWNSLLDGHLSLDDLRSLATDNGADASSNYFGSTLSITGSVSLPNGNVLTYQSSDNKGHYLESVSYDHFDGHSWSLSPSSYTRQYDRSAYLSQSLLDSADNAESIFTSVQYLQTINGSRHFLFAPAVPEQFSVPADVTYGLVDGKQDALSWSTPLPMTQGSTFEVISSLPASDAAALSTVPLPADDAMFWNSDASAAFARQLYLQTPNDLSSNVQRTVEQWTRGAHNTYQALSQIEAHLSDTANFTYSVTNSAIPDNTDVVDWLLQTRSGYCTYYATAMVVMARLLHIPTRMMSGFSSGTYNATNKSWVVQGSDAHSWVQAYFPGYGWINFDPTPGYGGQAQSAALPTPTTQAAAATPTPAATAAATPRVQATQTAQSTQPALTTTHHQPSLATIPVWLLLLLVLVGGLIVLGILLVFGLRRTKHLATPGGLYLRACHLASLVGLGPRRWQTPYEYSEMLSNRMTQRDPILWRLTELFVHERWDDSATRMTQQEQKELQHGWSHLRLNLLRRILFHWPARQNRSQR